MRFLLLATLAFLTIFIPQEEYPPEGPPLIPVETLLRIVGFPIPVEDEIEVTEGDTTEITILVVLASGVSSTNCQTVINRINTAAINSAVATVQVRLVGCMPTTYISSGTTSTDLQRITFRNDGFLEDVHTERDRLCADTVIFFVKSCNFCGQAWLTANNSSAFAVVCDSCVTNFSGEHEWLHNVGGNHDLPNASSCPFGYGCGWCFGNGFKDLMTYPSPCGGNRVAYYSNPNVLFNGVPTGTATANNARVLRERAGTLAAFRNPCVSATTNHPL